MLSPFFVTHESKDMSRKRAAKRAAKRNKSSASGRQDHYFQKAKKESYAARAVYKLEQIDKKYHLFKSGDKVLDLGCHPGSWMQYAAKRIGGKGLVIGIDLAETSPPADNSRTLCGDIYDITAEQIGEDETSFAVVMSDMAPNTSGIKNVDQLRSAALAERALELALTFCKPGGHFVVKIFMGPDEPKIYNMIREHFTRALRYKPDASRSESSESYLVGLERKPGESS